MHLTALELTDFRSYRQLSLPVRPGITVMVGPNGQGKTNIVEALWYLATLSSHRVPHDAALVHRGESTAIVRASFERAGRPLQIDLEITPGKANRARLQGQNVSRLRDLLGEVRAVLFAPVTLSPSRGGNGHSFAPTAAIQAVQPSSNRIVRGTGGRTTNTPPTPRSSCSHAKQSGISGRKS